MFKVQVAWFFIYIYMYGHHICIKECHLNKTRNSKIFYSMILFYFYGGGGGRTFFAQNIQHVLKKTFLLKLFFDFSTSIWVWGEYWGHAEYLHIHFDGKKSIFLAGRGVDHPPPLKGDTSSKNSSFFTPSFIHVPKKVYFLTSKLNTTSIYIPSEDSIDLKS